MRCCAHMLVNVNVSMCGTCQRPCREGEGEGSLERDTRPCHRGLKIFTFSQVPGRGTFFAMSHCGTGGARGGPVRPHTSHLTSHEPHPCTATAARRATGHALDGKQCLITVRLIDPYSFEGQWMCRVGRDGVEEGWLGEHAPRARRFVEGIAAVNMRSRTHTCTQPNFPYNRQSTATIIDRHRHRASTADHLFGLLCEWLAKAREGALDSVCRR